MDRFSLDADGSPGKVGSSGEGPRSWWCVDLSRASIWIGYDRGLIVSAHQNAQRPVEFWEQAVPVAVC
jgi:hypothetical protein